MGEKKTLHELLDDLKDILFYNQDIRDCEIVSFATISDGSLVINFMDNDEKEKKIILSLFD